MAVDQFNTKGKTPKQLGEELLKEVAKGVWGANTEKAFALIDAGASLEERDEKGNTPLLLTAKDGMPKIGVKLVDSNANINAVNNRGDSALIMSLQEPSMAMDQADDDFLPIADAILKKKPDVNIINKNNQSALLVAARRGYFKYTQQIVDLNPDFDVKDPWGKTPLEIAREKQHGEASLKILEQGYEVFQRRQAAKAQFEKVVNVGKAMASGIVEDMEPPVKASFVRRKGRDL